MRSDLAQDRGPRPRGSCAHPNSFRSRPPRVREWGNPPGGRQGPMAANRIGGQRGRRVTWTLALEVEMTIQQKNGPRPRLFTRGVSPRAPSLEQVGASVLFGRVAQLLQFRSVEVSRPELKR